MPISFGLTSNLSISQNLSVGGTAAIGSSLTLSDTTASSLLYGNASKVVSSVTLASNLSLTTGTLALAAALTGINSVTSVAGQNLVLALGTGGTALTLANSTLAATFAGNSIAMAGGSSWADSSGTATISGGSSGASLVLGQGTTAGVTVAAGATGGTATAVNTGGLRSANFGLSTVSGGASYFGGNVTSATQYTISGAGAVPTASTIAIGTNGAGTRMVLNVPTGGEINLNVNGTLVTAVTGTLGLYTTGLIQSTNTTPSTGLGTGALQVAGGIYAGAASVFGGAVTATGASTTSSALNVVNDTGASGQHYIRFGTTGVALGRFQRPAASNAIELAVLDSATVSLNSLGGSGGVFTVTGGNATFAGAVSVASTTPSTGLGTGALQVAGGIYAGAASVFAGAVTTNGALFTQSASLPELRISDTNGVGTFGQTFYSGSTYEASIKYATNLGVMTIDAGRSAAWNAKIDLYVDTTRSVRFAKTLTTFDQAATFAGLVFPQQATTAGAPTYVKGAIYFDTTLNKLRVGGASAWETITSV